MQINNNKIYHSHLFVELAFDNQSKMIDAVTEKQNQVWLCGNVAISKPEWSL